MEPKLPKLPKIKPIIQPNKIVRKSKVTYGGGVNSKGVNPLVRNITSSDNLFSKLQEKNPEVKNKRGTRTLFNMLGTFGTERNEKIIRKNLQLLRNTLVETFEIAKILRMNAGGKYGGGVSAAGIAGAGIAGFGLGAAGAAITGAFKNIFGGGDDDEDDKEINADKEIKNVEEVTATEDKEEDFDNAFQKITAGINKDVESAFDSLLKGINQLQNGEGIEVNTEETTDNTLEVKEESSGEKNVNSLVDGIGNSFKDNLKGKIAEGESNTNYGAMYSRDQKGFSRGDEDITKMSISEVDKLQTDYLNYQTSIGREEDNQSAAMGAYQMLDVKKVAELMGLDPETTVFNKETQDKMADYYLNYAGLKEFQAGTMSAEEFNNNLAGQFASLKTTDGKGQFDTDKMNKANTSVFDLIKSQESKYKDLDMSTLLKGKGKGEVIFIDNTKDIQMIDGPGGGKRTVMVNNNSGRGKSEGPKLAFLSSSDPDGSNIATKSVLGLVG